MTHDHKSQKRGSSVWVQNGGLVEEESTDARSLFTLGFTPPRAQLHRCGYGDGTPFMGTAVNSIMTALEKHNFIKNFAEMVLKVADNLERGLQSIEAEDKEKG